ncbi:MAG: carboxypeptidase-like regulatory domain-containing protein [Clostridiales bacterium]|jgi:hypothetical protein|nr:carboxypeptidase-like regulatory domain-containing protein [Clostridiales bacterium]
MIRKINLLLLSLAILKCIPVEGQNKINGRVVDANTSESLPFVSVYIPTNNNKSTITNINGDFTVNDISENDTIHFSYIGYEVRSMIGREIAINNKIQLQSKMFELPEILVTNINIRELIKSSFDKMKVNYPPAYPILQGIYRKQISENNTCVFIGESRLVIKPVDLKGLMKGKKSKVSFSDIRISANNQSDKSTNFNFIIDPAPYPVFSELRPENFSDFEWEIMGVYDSENDNRIFKIKFTGRPSSGDSLKIHNSGIVYVSEKDRAILATRIVRKLKDQISTGKDGITTDNYLIWDAYYKKNGAYYQYDYMRSEWKFKYSSKEISEGYYTITADYLNENIPASNKLNDRLKKAIFDPFREPQNAKILPFSALNKITPDYDFK